MTGFWLVLRAQCWSVNSERGLRPWGKGRQISPVSRMLSAHRALSILPRFGIIGRSRGIYRVFRVIVRLSQELPRADRRAFDRNPLSDGLCEIGLRDRWLVPGTVCWFPVLPAGSQCCLLVPSAVRGRPSGTEW